MDPITISLIAGGVSTLAGLIGGWIKKHKKQKNIKRGNTPVKFSDDDIKLVQTLPEPLQKIALQYADQFAKNPDDFIGKFPSLDTKDMESIIQKDLPTGQELGFDELHNNIPELMQDTEFGPIADLARKQFNEETVPNLAERFAGSGGLNSSALIGQLGKAGSDLESKLAAMKSQHGLERAGTLGSLTQGQQALGLTRSKDIASLGMGLRNQQFNQRESLANLRLAQNQQELARRGQSLGTLGDMYRNSQLSSLKLNGGNGFNDLTQVGSGILGKGFKAYLGGI
jgi:hypothetical protein